MNHYILLYAYNSYLFILQNLWIKLLVILLSSFLLILLIINNQTIFNKLTYNDMKITNWMPFWLIVFVSLTTYLGFFSYRRIYYIGKSFDLKLFIYNAYLFIKHYNLSILMLVFLCALSLLFLYLCFFKFIKNFIFVQALKVHIIIMSKTIFREKSIIKRNWYDKLILKLINLEYYLPDQLLKFFVYLSYKKQYGQYFVFRTKIIEKYNYYTHRDRFNLYLISFMLFYDIIFNNLVINKIYYILPIVFISFLIKKVLPVMCFFEKADCIQLYSIFYHKVKAKKNLIITFENEVTVESYEINDINDRLQAEFDPSKSKASYLGYIEKVKEGLFFLIFNALLCLYIVKNTDIIVEILLFQQIVIMKVNIILLMILTIQTIFWFNIKKNKFLKYGFWLFSMTNVIISLVIFIKHNVPLLFNENNIYGFITIKDNYTIQEKLYFIKEYFKYKTNHLANTDREYLLKIIENISLKEHIGDTTFETLTVYVDNIISLYAKMELKISLIIDIHSQILVKNIREEYYNIIEYYFNIVHNIFNVLTFNKVFKYSKKLITCEK